MRFSPRGALEAIACASSDTSAHHVANRMPASGPGPATTRLGAILWPRPLDSKCCGTKRLGSAAALRVLARPCRGCRFWWEGDFGQKDGPKGAKRRWGPRRTLPRGSLPRPGGGAGNTTPGLARDHAPIAAALRERPNWRLVCASIDALPRGMSPRFDSLFESMVLGSAGQTRGTHRLPLRFRPRGTIAGSWLFRPEQTPPARPCVF